MNIVGSSIQIIKKITVCTFLSRFFLTTIFSIQYFFFCQGKLIKVYKAAIQLTNYPTSQLCKKFNFFGSLVVIIAIHKNVFLLYIIDNQERGRHGRDRKVVGFTTTYAISAYHH